MSGHDGEARKLEFVEGVVHVGVADAAVVHVDQNVIVPDCLSIHAYFRKRFIF